MKSLFTAAAIAGAAGLMLSTSAQAADITISSVAGFAASEPAVIDFEDGGAYIADDHLLGFDWSGGAVIAHPPTTGHHAVPFGDSSNFYLSIPGLASEELSINTAITGGPLSSLKLFIGSLDTYNSIEFCAGGLGGHCDTLSGTDLLNSVPTPLADSGDQTSPLTNREFTFNFDPSFAVDTVVFSSTKDAFEIDNLNPFAVVERGGPGVPEPSVWIVMLAGFGLLGLALRSRTLGGFAHAA
jgi:hypothetical protein